MTKKITQDQNPKKTNLDKPKQQQETIKKTNNENPKKFQNHQTKTFTKVITKKIIINEEKSSDESQEILEIGLLCDCTSSMKDWIERAKETLN